MRHVSRPRLTSAYREAAESRNQAGRARSEAFKVRQSADDKIEQIRNEAKTLISRGELSAEEAKRSSSKLISDVQAEAERKCKVLRERHNEHEILLGKLMASNDNLYKKIQHSDKLTEEHDDMIKNIIKYTGEKFEDFEQNTHRLAKNNVSLDNKIENKLRTLEDKVGEIGLTADSHQSEIVKFKKEINQNLMVFTVLPFIGLFFLYFWICFTLPTRIASETKPSFEEIQHNIDFLRKGIESKVANLELDTFSEIKLSKKALSSLDKNLEQRFEMFIRKFQKELQIMEIQLDKFEKSYKSDVVGLKEDLEDKLSEIQVETLDRISEASTKIDEFMVPKLWLSKVNPKEKGVVLESSSLGLYREEGKENLKPFFKQVGGDWTLHFTDQQKWILSTPRSSEEEEVFFQLNPKLPELTTDKWRYPSHKVSVVHTVPCCKNIRVHQKTEGGGEALLSSSPD